MFSTLRYSFRRLVASPGFTVTALITLALGIGVNTSMFSALYALMFRTPYPDDAGLVRVFRTSPQSQSWPHSVANFLDHRAQNSSFEHLAALNWTNFNLAEPGQPAERLRGLSVSADFFPILGVQPELGRFFTAEEDAPGKNTVVLISYAVWQQRFGGAHDVVGRELRINGETVTIIGVMPARFDYPMLWGRVDAWRPIAFSDQARQNRGNNYLNEIARLKPGVTLAQAQAEMTAIARRIETQYPANNSQSGLRLVPLARSAQDAFGNQITWFVVGLAGFVLLIACANLANLQFARHAARARELAIRSALGASRARLIRDVLTESLLLALVGGTLGLLVALWCNDALGSRFVMGDINGVKLALDWRALAFTFAASVATGLAFGIMPAWFSSRTDVTESLKQGGRGSTAGRATHRMRHALIVAEVALALVLLAGAGFFLRGIDRFLQRDPGWRTEELVTGYLNLRGKNYATPQQRHAFHQRLQEKLAALPGVKRAAIGTTLPTWGFGSSSNFVVAGRPAPVSGTEPLATQELISPDYFDAIGLPLVAGRRFTADDIADKPAVTIINETMARTFWPGENPIGKRLGPIGAEKPEQWREVVGVVRDAGAAGYLGAVDTRFQEYLPLAQIAGGNFLALALRTSLAPNVVGAQVSHAVAEIDSDLPVYSIDAVRNEIQHNLGATRLAGETLAAFALLGVLLAGVGIYGVISGFVVQRTNEIGIRMALGAQVRDILALVLGRGLRLAILGTALGLAGAWGVARMLVVIAPGLPPADFATAGVVTFVLLAIAALACWLPARRATKVDPMTALRTE